MQGGDLVEELRRTPGWPTLGNSAADEITRLRAEGEAKDAEIADLHAVLDNDPDGSGFWRFWSRKALEMASKVEAAKQERDAYIRACDSYAEDIAEMEALEARATAAEAQLATAHEEAWKACREQAAKVAEAEGRTLPYSHIIPAVSTAIADRIRNMQPEEKP